MADVIDQTDDREAIMESLRAKARASFKPRHSVECVECGDVIPEERQRASLGGSTDICVPCLNIIEIKQKAYR